jgi:hypothetical protein
MVDELTLVQVFTRVYSVSPANQPGLYGDSDIGERRVLLFVAYKSAFPYFEKLSVSP